MKFFAAFIRRRQREQELDEEIRAHLAMAIRERIERGESPAEAEANARREFGNEILVKEITRDMWGWRWLETLIQDLRFGLRQLRRNPGFTAIAIITLALGIGANTAIFSVIDAVLLHPLPYRDPGRLMQVYHYEGRDVNYGPFSIAPADFLDWKAQNDVFEDIAASTLTRYNVTGGATAVHIAGVRATTNLFSILGVAPLLGRTFNPSDAQPGKDNVVVLGYGFWQEAFASRRNVLGKTIRLNGEPFKVVGVMPSSFRYPYFARSDMVFLPLWFTSKDRVDRNSRRLDVIARLKPGVTYAQAQATMKAIGERFQKAYPQADKDVGAWAQPYDALPWIWQFVKPLFDPLYAAALCVLAVGCVNLANLLLARGAVREHEIAVRVALGAGRLRLIRQFMTEGVLLSVLGGAAGILIAVWGASLFKALIPPDRLPNIQGAHMDLRVLLFGLVIGLIAGVAFSIIPAWRASKVDPHPSIQQGGRMSRSDLGARKARGILLLAESTLVLVLLFGAGLILQAFMQLMHTDPGFNPHHLLAFAIDVDQHQYPKSEMWPSFFERIAENLQSLPGVASVAIAQGVASTDRQTVAQFGMAGRTLPAGRSRWVAVYERVGPNYFKTLQNPLEKGRYFTSADNAASPSVAIVTDTLVHQHFRNGNPIGKQIDIRPLYGPRWKRTVEIVGVVRAVRQYSLAQPFLPEIYVPERQDPDDSIMIVLRTKQNPQSLIPAIRQRVARVAPSQPIYDLRTIDQRYEDTASLQHVDAVIFSGFALITLLLAGVGIYGVTAYGVNQRFHEIGIRVALGATKEHILRLVVKQAMRWVLFGVTLGCVLLPAFRNLLAAMLGTGANHLSTAMRLQGGLPVAAPAIAAIVFIIAAALLACYIPARQATKVNPVVALRHE